ncbi:MAG: ATP-binding protein [Candidatus Brocadiaceae bacterium]|jgi:signal transduction histidine kinase
MARYRGSISLRLALGFVLVLAVLGSALLISLNQLAKIRNAGERLTVYLEVRRQAIQINAAAQEASRLRSRLLTPAGADPEVLDELRSECERLEHMVEPLQAGSLDNPERGYVEQLDSAAAALHTLVKTRALATAGVPGTSPRVVARAAEFPAASRELIDRIRQVSSALADSFDIRMLQASDQAEGTWAVSMATAKIVFPVALLVSLLVIYYTHRAIVRPVETLVEGTHALAEGDLGNRIRLRGAGEFAELAESFNRMAGALEANQRQLVETEKLATIGRLAAGVAHEINNPITVIMGYTKMLLSRLEEGSLEKEQLENIAEEAQQCKNIVNSLLDLSRPSEPSPGNLINPSEVVTEVLSVTETLQFNEGVDIEESVIDRPMVLNIGHSRLRQLILNIVRNALEELQGADEPFLRVEGYVRPRDKLNASLLDDGAARSDSFLVFVFTDNGPGIPAGNLERLFEPFFTTKPDGVGLGLAICRNITRAHDGFIDVQSEPGGGTTFTVGLPLADED